MIVGSKVILRKKKLADAREDFTWETDPELARLDAVAPETIAYSFYLSEYTRELRESLPTSYRFSVDTLDGMHIGNCSYYNTNEAEGETEVGIMIGDRDYWDKGYGADAITTLVSHLFQQTNFDRIYLKTLKTNARAQKCFKKCGFSLYGHFDRNGFSFALMEIYRKQWQQTNPA